MQRVAEVHLPKAVAVTIGGAAMMNVALIGCGFIGKSHLEAYKRIKSARLVAIVDSNETIGRKLAEETGSKYFQNIEDAFAKEAVDMADVCVPTFLHEKFVLSAAKNKKHILCEKPFALDSMTAQRMANVCEEAGVKLMIAQAARWWPENVKMKEVILDKLGPVRVFYCYRLAQHPNWSNWHTDPGKSGGALFDMHVHDIDYLYDIFGDVKQVFATGWKSSTGCWNHVITSMTFAHGEKAVAEGTFSMTGDYPFSMGMRATGENGTAEFDFKSGFNIDNPDQAKSEMTVYEIGKPPMKVAVAHYDAFEAEIKEFLGCITGKLPAPILPNDSVKVIRIIEAIKESLESERTVVL